MKRTIAIDDCGKGLNADLLPAELELGYWTSNTNLFIARNGFAEKWEGAVSLAGGSLITPYWFVPTDSGAGVVTAGVAVQYLAHPTTVTDITRYRKSETISTLVRLGANSAQVNTAAAHGLTTGDVITLFGATESGYNEVGASITVSDTDTFTYTTTNTIAANATVVGEYIVTSSSATSNFSSATEWSGGFKGGVLFMNHATDGLHYWDGNTSNNLRRFGFTTYKADLMVLFKDYLIQFAPTINGTKYRNRVVWSAAFESGSLPTTFESASSNDAGFSDIGEDATIIAAAELGDVLYIYTQSSMWAMRYIGGEFVFSFQKIDDVGATSRNAVGVFPGGQVFVTPGLDIRLHNGGASRSISNGKINSKIRTDFGGARFACVSLNPTPNEMCVAFGIAECIYEEMYVYSLPTGAWSFVNYPSSSPVTYMAPGMFPYSVSVTSFFSTLIYGKTGDIGGAFVSGTDGRFFGGSALTGTLERIGLHWGIRDRNKTIHRTRWNIDGTATNTATISHGAAATADATPTYASSVTYTIGTTDYCSQRSLSGRFNAIKLVSAAYPLKIRSIDVELTTEGTR